MSRIRIAVHAVVFTAVLVVSAAASAQANLSATLTVSPYFYNNGGLVWVVAQPPTLHFQITNTGDDPAPGESYTLEAMVPGNPPSPCAGFAAETRPVPAMNATDSVQIQMNAVPGTCFVGVVHPSVTLIQGILAGSTTDLQFDSAAYFSTDVAKAGEAAEFRVALSNIGAAWIPMPVAAGLSQTPNISLPIPPGKTLYEGTVKTDGATHKLDVTIPQSTPPGVWYMCFAVDSEDAYSESNESNNTACTPFMVESTVAASLMPAPSFGLGPAPAGISRSPIGPMPPRRAVGPAKSELKTRRREAGTLERNPQAAAAPAKASAQAPKGDTMRISPKPKLR